MSKVDELMKKYGKNAQESINGGRAGLPPLAFSGSSQTTGGVGSRDGIRMNRSSVLIEVRQIIPDPNQPRKEFDINDLATLTASVKKMGVLMPVRVRWESSANKWILISGERRFRAAQAAGLETVPATLVESPLTPSELLSEQLVENLLRSDLKPVEQARAYAKLMDLEGLTGQELAGFLSVNSSTISRALALLKLDETVQASVDAGTITPKVAVELARIHDPEKQKTIAQEVVEQKLTAEETTERIQRAGNVKTTKRRTVKSFRVFSGGTVKVSFPRQVDSSTIRKALEAALAQATGKAAA